MWRDRRKKLLEPRESRIVVSELRKGFEQLRALDGIDLVVEPGDLVCLLGPSGCGKTTLLRCIAGLERADAGKVSIGEVTMSDEESGAFVPPERRGLGMVFQHYALWPHMTVEQNIAYPLRKRGVPRSERGERIRSVVELVGLAGTLERRPAQLSGGQQQRVALARALVLEPPVLLLDEPLSNLDAILRRQLRREVRRLHERLGTTSVHVTHDQEEAAALADVIVVMHDGRVVQSGTHEEIFHSPRTRFVAEFVGFDNFMSGTVVDSRGPGAVVALGGGRSHVELARGMTDGAPDAEVLVAARSDALRLHRADDGAHAPGGVPGVVERVTRLGRGLELEVACGDEVIVVHEGDNGTDPTREPGDEVTVEIPTTSPLVVS